MNSDNASADLVVVKTEERPDGRIAFVIANNPAKRNAIGMPGKRALVDAFKRLSADDALRAVVLTGAGDKSFIAGADLAEMKDLDAAQAHEEHTLTHLACDAIRTCPVPVIARINGYCLGAGMELAASCDMRAAADHAKFGMPEVRVGLPSGMEAALLPALVGWGKAAELVLTGDVIDAAEAHRIGFVQRLVPASALDAAVERWIASILASGPRAVRLQKALLRDWERMSIADAVQQGIRACVAARDTEEPKRMMEAFLARKRGARREE
jgi:enoyl-CoA hydratase/carnithine racemase